MGWFSFSKIYTLKVIFNYDAIDILNREKVLIQTKRDYIQSKANSIRKYLFGSTFIWAAIGFYLNFNIVTILIFEIFLLVFYSSVSLIKHIPNNIATITLVDGTILRNVYIIDDFTKDYINTIDKREKQQIIMKSSISKIYTDITTKPIITPIETLVSEILDQLMLLEIIPTIWAMIKPIVKLVILPFKVLIWLIKLIIKLLRSLLTRLRIT